MFCIIHKNLTLQPISWNIVHYPCKLGSIFCYRFFLVHYNAKQVYTQFIYCTRIQSGGVGAYTSPAFDWQ